MLVYMRHSRARGLAIVEQVLITVNTRAVGVVYDVYGHDITVLSTK